MPNDYDSNNLVVVKFLSETKITAKFYRKLYTYIVMESLSIFKSAANCNHSDIYGRKVFNYCNPPSTRRRYVNTQLTLYFCIHFDWYQKPLL